MNNQETMLLQHWMSQVITSPGNLQYKLQTAQHLYELDEHDVVAESGKANVYARLNVYVTGYVLRLLDCLSADFPVFQKFVGDDVFNAFAKASLAWSPSTSYTLYDMGKTFIAFLEATRPKQPANAEADKMFDLPIAIAKLERARQEVMRSPGTEGTGALPDINLEDILWQPHQVILTMPESTRLLQLAFPLKTFFEQVNKEEPHELPEPQTTYMAVGRKHYRITMEELQDWQYHFLQSCTRPVSLMHAIESTVKAGNYSSSELMADLYIWLPVLCGHGLLVWEAGS